MLFCLPTVAYLGHIITAEGLKPNPDRVDAVRLFSVPTDLSTFRQFLGLASFYRKFVPNFACIASPLHELTKKGVPFTWTEACQSSFSQLKQKLIEAPVLAYPDFTKPFVLETDASIHGLGAILSQINNDNMCHPIAYASRALSAQEKRYAITEQETLAVVWAVSHFHSYLYGHDVTIFTDHSAVRAVLGNTSGNGKHARWWTRVHGAGLRTVTIVHRAGRDNGNADALSRQPHLPAPLVGIADDDAHVLSVTTPAPQYDDISILLTLQPESVSCQLPAPDFAQEQRKTLIFYCCYSIWKTRCFHSAQQMHAELLPKHHYSQWTIMFCTTWIISNQISSKLLFSNTLESR